jgi:hypothetical protein
VTIRINVWSSPRNLSTALMYSFRQRADTTVVDEPLYAHYLRATGRIHPGTDEVLASQDADGERVVRDVILGPVTTPVVMFKQMAKHLVDLDRDFLASCRNVLLTRDPHDMITSFQRQVPDVTFDDTGFSELVDLLDTTLANGEEPIVVEASALLRDPAGVLAELCRRLGLEPDESMLTWPAGPKPEDGVWAPHWYDGVRASTGWQPYRPKVDQLADSNVATYEQCLPYYERLIDHLIQAPVVTTVEAQEDIQ